MNIAELRNLRVSYGGREVLTGVDLDLAEGSFVAVVGPNGGGKTTLLRVLLGLIAPYQGTVRILGLPPSEAVRKHPIGYLPQRSSWADPRFPATVRETVASGLLSRKRFPRVFGAADREAVQRMLELLRIEDIAEKRIGELSGGQQQRAHLARALVSRPRLLVLDEPTGALDPGTRGCFYETLAAFNAQDGVTVLVVSHDIEGVGPFAKELVYVDRQVVYAGPPENLAAGAGGMRVPETHYFGSGHTHRHGGCADA